MSASPIFIGQGFQNLIDAQQRWVRGGHTVYLRIRNFPDPQATNPAVQLGFSITPTGTATGTTDILIDPPPSVTMLTMQNVAKSMGKLRIGARQFLISNTFVNLQQTALAFLYPSDVFRLAIGLVCDGQLFSIEDYAHEEYGGVTLLWTVRGNALETINPGAS